VRQIVLIGLWAVGGTIGFVFAVSLLADLFVILGILGVDASGRPSVGNMPVFGFICGPAPIVFVALLILGFRGTLPGTKIPIRPGLTAEQYWSCPACGYDMSTIKSDLCPECGESLSMLRSR